MADDNIFQQYLRPPKSVMDYTADYDAADARKQTLGQNALELAAGQQKYSDGVQSRQRADQLRQALMGLPQGATDDQRIQAMRGTASPEGFAAADALDKSLIERRKGTAAADKDDAETAKTKLAQSVALHNFQAQKLATVQSPEDALAWADESRALGLFSKPGQYEQGVARIQAAAPDPKAFAQWKAAAMQGGQSVTEQLKQQFEQLKQQEQVRQFGVTDQRIQSEGSANRNNQIKIQNMIGERQDRADAAGQESPENIERMAAGIASGRLAPMSSFAMLKPSGKAIMARVLDINPTYDSGDYLAKNKALRDFSTGTQGLAVQAANTGLNHLDTIEQLAKAQKNGDTRLFNTIANKIARETGAAAPTNLASAITMVAPEISKMVIGAAGGQEERATFAKNFSPSFSPEQAIGGIHTIRELLGGRLSESERTYKRTTGRDDFNTGMLSPAAQKVLGAAYGNTGASTPSQTAAGAPSDIDALLKKYGGK